MLEISLCQQSAPFLKIELVRKMHNDVLGMDESINSKDRTQTNHSWTLLNKEIFGAFDISQILVKTNGLLPHLWLMI